MSYFARGNLQACERDNVWIPTFRMMLPAEKKCPFSIQYTFDIGNKKFFECPEWLSIFEWYQCNITFFHPWPVEELREVRKEGGSLQEILILPLNFSSHPLHSQVTLCTQSCEEKSLVKTFLKQLDLLISRVCTFGDVLMNRSFLNTLSKLIVWPILVFYFCHHAKKIFFIILRTNWGCYWR